MSWGANLLIGDQVDSAPERDACLAGAGDFDLRAGPSLHSFNRAVGDTLGLTMPERRPTPGGH